MLKDGVKNFNEIIGKKTNLNSYKLDAITISLYIVELLCQKNVNLLEKFL